MRMKEAGRYKIALFVSTIVMLNVLTSCSLLKKIEYRDLVVDHYNTVTVHDTTKIKEKDSTYHFIRVVNDTVFDTKYVEKTKYRDRVVVKTDTCYRDSIQVQIKESVVEKQKIPKWCYYCLVVSVLFIIFALIKLIRWLQIR